MKAIIYITVVLTIIGSSTKQTDKKHVFYLHGRIIEVQGVNAFSKKFGKYLYRDIIDSLKSDGIIMHNEIRKDGTDFKQFTNKVSSQIDSLISSGVKPKNITVIGASKGAVMAMYISNMNLNEINYVLLAANNNNLENRTDWTLHGNILGIYEISDSIAGKNYQYWIEKSKDASKFEEIELHTGLGHGFLFQPINEWLLPTKEWIEKQEITKK